VQARTLAELGADDAAPELVDDDQADDHEHDEGGALPLAAQVSIWIKEASDTVAPGLNTAATIEWRHQFLAAWSDGTISSAKDVHHETVPDLRATLVRVKRGELRLDVSGERPVLRTASMGLPTSDAAGVHAVGRAAGPDFSKMKVPELVQACRDAGLEVGGTKAEMVARLEGREVDA
jgi:hypothetical protein